MSLTKFAKKTLSKVLEWRAFRVLLTRYYYRNIVARADLVARLKTDGHFSGDKHYAARLRYAAHIIDKGIHAPEFQAGRGQRAFQEAKECVAAIRGDEWRNDPSVVWATGRLDEYSRLQRGEPRTRDVIDGCAFSYDDVKSLLRSRRSIRDYLRREVEADALKKSVDLVGWAPSSCNRQTARIFACRNPVKVGVCMKCCKGVGGFSDYVPLFVSFCADLSAYEMPAEACMPYIDVSLGVQNFLLASHSLGISFTLLSWAGHSRREDRRLRELLEIPEEMEIVINGVGGYPASGVLAPGRKRLTELLSDRA